MKFGSALIVLLLSLQLLHVEIASTCEPGSIGAVIVFVAVIIVAKVCDDHPRCTVTVNGQQQSGPLGAPQTPRPVWAKPTRIPISPFKRRCNRSTQRKIAPDEFNPRRPSFETARRASPFPVRTNGSAITIEDVPRRRRPDTGRVPTSARRPVERVRRNEVAENWQLVCANNAARLPPQRLVGDEQTIASCLERCSQKLMKPSEGACRWRLGSSAVLGPQLPQSARTDKEQVRKRIQAAFEEQKHSVRNRREGRMAVAQDFNGYSVPRRHFMSAALEKEVAVATNGCDCKLGGKSLMSVADMSFGPPRLNLQELEM